jgi:peptide/nickel transport system permease protein
MLMMIGKRLMFAIPSLIGVVIVTFLLTRALPGDPGAYFAGPAATKEAVEQIRKKLGLDRPLIEQFFRYTKISRMAISAIRSPRASRWRPKSETACRPPPN